MAQLEEAIRRELGDRAEAIQVSVRPFASPEAAAQHHRDDAEGSCRRGDGPFRTATPGAVGMRCACGVETYLDRLAILRGSIRIELLEDELSADDDHTGVAVAGELARMAMGEVPRIG